jgi:hypothetical protein
MKKKLVVAGLTTMLGLTWGIGGASAHPVGQDPSEPNCYGQRVSHGSSVHGDTPKDRAGYQGTSVREWHQFVKQCPPEGSRFP